MKTKTDVKIIIVSKHKRRQGQKEKGNKDIINIDISEIQKVIKNIIVS